MNQELGRDYCECSMRAEREERHQMPPSPASSFIMPPPTGHKESLTVEDPELWIGASFEKPHPRLEALQPVRRVQHALSGSTKLFLFHHPGRGQTVFILQHIYPYMFQNMNKLLFNRHAFMRILISESFRVPTINSSICVQCDSCV